MLLVLPHYLYEILAAPNKSLETIFAVLVYFGRIFALGHEDNQRLNLV